MRSITGRTANRILDLLPEEESRRLLPFSQTVFLPRGHELFEHNGPIPHVYFPTTGVCGIMVLLESGKQVAGTIVGREGMVGLPVFLGLDSHPFPAVSQVPGEAVRVPAATFRHAITPGGTLDRLLRRYTLYRMRCANQTGACNSLHSAEQRMARWLLMAHDRAGSPAFPLTHEALSDWLGIRRQTVSSIAAALQRAGFIAYRRGVLQVLDREGLASASCECYEALTQLYHRIVR